MYRLTLPEFLRVARAHRARVRDAWERMAVQTSYLLAPWVKTPPTPAEILGETRASPEHAEAILDAVVDGTSVEVAASVSEFDQFMKAQRGPDT